MAPVPKIWPTFILSKGQIFGLEMGHNSKHNSLNQKKPPSISKLYHNDSSLKICGYINQHLERYEPQKSEKLIFYKYASKLLFRPCT